MKLFDCCKKKTCEREDSEFEKESRCDNIKSPNNKRIEIPDMIDIDHENNSLLTGIDEESELILEDNFRVINEEHKRFYNTKLSDKSLDQIMIDPEYVRAEEMNLISFTKRGLIKFTEDLLSLSDFNKFYDKDDIKLWDRRSGSSLSNFVLGKCEYKASKSLLKRKVTLKELSDFVIFY